MNVASASGPSPTPMRSGAKAGLLEELLGRQKAIDHDLSDPDTRLADVELLLRHSTDAAASLAHHVSGPAPSQLPGPTGSAAKAKSSSPTKRKRIQAAESSSEVAGPSVVRLAPSTPNGQAKDVLSSPRRGRRVAGVDLGWSSPIADAPKTFPRMEKRPRGRPPKRANVAAAVAVTPSKRRGAPTCGDQQWPSLAEARGRAAAVVVRPHAKGSGPAAKLSSGIPHFKSTRVQSERDAVHSHDSGVTREASRKCGSRETPSGHSQRDCLSLFRGSASAPSTPPRRRLMVPVEVSGMGRIAVHSELASQIARTPGGTAVGEEEQRSNAGVGYLQTRQAGSDTEGSSASTGRAPSTSTMPTSVATPCPQSAGPSPSFSLSSEFPNSPPSSPSPSTACRARSSAHVSTLLARAQEGEGARLTSEQGTGPASSARARLDSPPLYRARLGGTRGSQDSRARLPTLDWPDAPDGPWAAASRHLRKEHDARISVVARWLDEAGSLGDSDEDHSSRLHCRPVSLDEALEPNVFYATSSDNALARQHPMVTKALRDRARKAAAAAAQAKTPRRRAEKAEARKALAAGKLAKVDAQLRKRLEKKARKTQARAMATGATVSAAGAEEAPQLHGEDNFVTPRKRGAGMPKAVVTPALLSRHAPSASIIGCVCGIEDESFAMVQCDLCSRWFHLFCLGLATVEDLGEEWFCDGCCEFALHNISPGSAASTVMLRNGSVMTGTSSSSMGSTPLLHRGGIIAPELAHGSVPVFSQPSDSPLAAAAAARMSGHPSLSALQSQHHHPSQHQPPQHHFSVATRNAMAGGNMPNGLAAALALAPSPQMLSGAEAAFKAAATTSGRTRAPRIGQYSMEPSSPLEHKSAIYHGSSGSGSAAGLEPMTPPRRGPAETCVNLDEVLSSPMLYGDGAVRHATPSPRMGTAFSRHSSRERSGKRGTRRPQSSTRARHFDGSIGHPLGAYDSEEEEQRAADGSRLESDDVFSTPSRLFAGGDSWTSRGEAAREIPAGLQTPSRSAGRRREATARGGSGASSVGGPAEWALSTPGRNLMHGSAFSSDSAYYSAGLPSLIFSSAGLDHFDPTSDTEGEIATPSAVHSKEGKVLGSGLSTDSVTRRWLPSSPSFGTRGATRARQTSSSSSAMPQTPELLPQRNATASIRGAYGNGKSSTTATGVPSSRGVGRSSNNYGAGASFDSDDMLSSSPFPRTPTLSTDGGSPRLASSLSASRRLAKIATGNAPTPPPPASTQLADTGATGTTRSRRPTAEAHSVPSLARSGGAGHARKPSSTAGAAHGKAGAAAAVNGLVGLGLDDFLELE